MTQSDMSDQVVVPEGFVPVAKAIEPFKGLSARQFKRKFRQAGFPILGCWGRGNQFVLADDLLTFVSMHQTQGAP